MAQQYQLPGEFRAPDLSATAAVAGNETARDQEVMNNYLRQFNEATNIQNADRLMSLREREFAQQMVNNERDFQLRKDNQEFNWTNSNRNYEITKNLNAVQMQAQGLQFQKTQWELTQLKNQQAAQEKIAGMAPDLMTDFENKFGANPGYSRDFQKNYIRWRSGVAKTPAEAQAVDAIFQPYKDQYTQWGKDDLDSKLATIGSFEDRLEDIQVGELSGTDLYQQATDYYQNGDVFNAKRTLGILSREIEKTEVARKAKEKIGLLKNIQSETGQPNVTVNVGAGGEVSGVVAPSRYAGRYPAGVASRFKPLGIKEVQDYQNQTVQLDTDINDLNTKLEEYSSNPNAPEAVRLQAQLKDKQDQKDEIKGILELNRQTQVKNLEGIINPQAPQPAGVPGVPVTTMPLPTATGAQPAVAPTVPQTATTPSGARAVFNASQPKAPDLNAYVPKPTSKTNEETELPENRKTLMQGMEEARQRAKPELPKLQKELAQLQAIPNYIEPNAARFDEFAAARDRARRRRIAELQSEIKSLNF
jgi:hypothetical protein